MASLPHYVQMYSKQYEKSTNHNQPPTPQQPSHTLAFFRRLLRPGRVGLLSDEDDQ